MQLEFHQSRRNYKLVAQDVRSIAFTACNLWPSNADFSALNIFYSEVQLEALEELEPISLQSNLM